MDEARKYRSDLRNGENRLPVNLEKSPDGIFAGELRDLSEELLGLTGLASAGRIARSRRHIRKKAEQEEEKKA